MDLTTGKKGLRVPRTVFEFVKSKTQLLVEPVVHWLCFYLVKLISRLSTFKYTLLYIIISLQDLELKGCDFESRS